MKNLNCLLLVIGSICLTACPSGPIPKSEVEGTITDIIDGNTVELNTENNKKESNNMKNDFIIVNNDNLFFEKIKIFQIDKITEITNELNKLEPNNHYELIFKGLIKGLNNTNKTKRRELLLNERFSKSISNSNNISKDKNLNKFTPKKESKNRDKILKVHNQQRLVKCINEFNQLINHTNRLFVYKAKISPKDKRNNLPNLSKNYKSIKNGL